MKHLYKTFTCNFFIQSLFGFTKSAIDLGKENCTQLSAAIKPFLAYFIDFLVVRLKRVFFAPVFSFGVLLVMGLLVAQIGVGQIAIRGAFTSTTTTNTSLTITKPSGVVAGDIMLVNIAQGNNSTNAPTSSGWTLIDRRNITGTGTTLRYAAVMYKIAGASEPTNYTFTLGAGTILQQGL
jgi:hypothetical protein